MKTKTPGMSIAAFLEVVGPEIDDWKNTRSIVDSCDDLGFWSKDFLSKASYFAKAAWVRQALRALKDEKSWLPLFGSIVRTDPETGEKQRAYKDLRAFTVDDYQQVVHYWMDRKGYCQEIIRKYKRSCEDRFGKQQWLFEGMRP
jgi:hypothetical protein